MNDGYYHIANFLHCWSEANLAPLQDKLHFNSGQFATICKYVNVSEDASG